jgi:hypothetical protein
LTSRQLEEGVVSSLMRLLSPLVQLELALELQVALLL